MEGRKVISKILIIVLVLASLSLSGVIFYSLQKEKEKSAALQEALEDIKAKQKVTENKLEESRRMLGSLEAKLQNADNRLKDAQAQIDTLTRGLEEERSAKIEAANQIEKLKMELTQQGDLKTELEDKLNRTQKNLEGIQTKVSALEAKKIELESKIQNLETQANQEIGQGVELGKIVVSPEVVAKPPQTQVAAKEKQEEVSSGSEGKVLVVNKEYNFAVINLGSKDGVKLNDVFSVYNNNKYIGDVKVEKTHDSMSAAGFGSIDMKDKISEGDKVVRKSK
jgi:predicted RNase H-like nuclease (RuvC/YqgF family)